jgi:hypothetical protein
MSNERILAGAVVESITYMTGYAPRSQKPRMVVYATWGAVWTFFSILIFGASLW